MQTANRQESKRTTHKGIRRIEMRVFILGLTAALLLVGQVAADVQYGPAVQIESNWFETAYAPAGITWTQSALDAQGQGGYLAIIPDATTNSAVFNLISNPSFWSESNGYLLGPWIGGYASILNEWNWVTSVNPDGTPATFSSIPLPTPSQSPGYSNWWPGQPDNYGGLPEGILFFAGGPIGPEWGDATIDTETVGYADPQGFIVEFNSQPTQVPEPGPLTLLGLALLGVGVYLSQRMGVCFRPKGIALPG